MTPFVTVTGNDLSSAARAPTSATMSKFLSTRCPFTVTLNTRSRLFQ